MLKYRRKWKIQLRFQDGCTLPVSGLLMKEGEEFLYQTRPFLVVSFIAVFHQKVQKYCHASGGSESFERVHS